MLLCYFCYCEFTSCCAAGVPWLYMRNLVYKSRAQFAKDHQQYKKVVIASHCLNLVRACLDKSLARSIVQDMKSIAASLECSFFLCISFFFLRRWCQLGNELQYHKR